MNTRTNINAGDDDVQAAIAELTKSVTDALEQQAQRLDEIEKRSNDLTKAANRPSVGGNGNSDGYAAELKALSTFIRSGGRDDLELKELSSGSDTDGGYTVLPVLSDKLTKRLFDQSPMRRLARSEPIVDGDSFAELVDLDDIGATWVGETQSRPATPTAKWAKFEIPLREIYALQPVTQNLLDDSNRDIGDWVTEKIADKFGRSEGSAFVLGDGVGKPRGFLTYETDAGIDGVRANDKIQFVKTGDANGFAALNTGTGVNPADCLIDMVFNLRAPYKQTGKVSWLMNSKTASVIRKFKDGDGNYIWQNGVAAGQPASLLGFPVELDENMPDIGAGSYPIAFANWTLGYCIVDRPGLKMLTDPYSDKPNVLFYAYKRVGGGVALFDAIKLLKVAS